MSDIKANLQEVQSLINKAEAQAGRSNDSVKLMAVSKFHPKEAVEEAIACGQLLFGENRVQEAVQKFTPILAANPKVELHIIGQLQTNKVKQAVTIAASIDSVDRLDLLKEIEKQCAKLDKTIKVLFEYHTGEESKAGFTSEEALIEALEACKRGDFPHIIPSGFMTMAPFTQDQELIHKSFITLRTLAQKLKEQYPQFPLKELSMGMSGDFEAAIQQGSTMVRVGTAIFGQRNY
ncbi:MAG: YggS family pyridoxal phosphate-dependent enzyme [Treponema sp.]|nr:YggS family pyridoxal phosphate-dependent enzyme [Treponema sp.]